VGGEHRVVDERTAALFICAICGKSEVKLLSHFESNLAILSRRQPNLAESLRKEVNTRVKVFPSSCGLPTASCEYNSSSVPLHSRHDPLREARQRLKGQTYSGADYFILLGFGLGYPLDALLEETRDPSNHYFIVESDLTILKAAFEARDLSSLLSLPHVHLAWPASGPELAEQWYKFFDPVQAQKSTFLTYLPSVALDPEFFKAAAKLIQSQTFQTFTDINTLVAGSQEFLDNFVQNLLRAARAPGVIHFAGMFSGVPAVVVSAGPSLDKNIHELRGNQDKVLILATDTALKPLLAAGIDPHFVLTGDPSEVNFFHLKGASTRRALLVSEATSYPAVFTEFEERIITCTFENSALRSLSDLLGNKGTLRAWGSVATLALDFALLLQCNPVIFIGQDLAHTDERIYCTGVYFEEEWFSSVADPEALSRQLRSLRSGRRVVATEDIHGRPIESTDKLVSYWNWMLKVFRDHPEVHFINATEGGILRDKVEIASLKEVLYRYGRNNLDLQGTIQNLYKEARQKTLVYSSVDIAALEGEMAALQDVLRLGFQICKGKSDRSPEDLMKRLEATKNSIYFNPHIAPLLDCLNQMGNVTFLRRRHGLTRQGLMANLLPEIEETYFEYFVSVQTALGKIQEALSKIETDLSLDVGRLSGAARPHDRRIHYSRKPEMSIS
jgi:hypothetical protein